MQITATQMHSDRYRRLGEIIEQDARLLTDRWLQRAIEEYPNANRKRRDVMRDDLPEYLAVLGGQLASTGTDGSETQSKESAREHGKQRWHVGWSLEEVVRDYQIMRLVVVQHLANILDPPLTVEEVQAVNLILDEAIAGAVLAYVEESETRYQKLNGSLETKVLERTRQLRDLARALVEAEQRERRRIARLLHEHFQQILFAIRLRLEKLHRTFGTQQGSLISEINDLLVEAIDDARSLTASLSPPVLAAGGLVPALESLAELMHDRHELQVNLHIGEFADPETMVVTEFLYQAVREMLLNVVKHSGQQKARVAMNHIGPGRIRIVVEDEGNGMPTASADAPAAASQGFGLVDIRQRVEGLGGTLIVQNGNPRGLTVVLEVPTSTST